MHSLRRLLIVFALLIVACGGEPAASAGNPPAGKSTAIFAGGCFWCMEPPFDRIDGVYSTTSGYIGGHLRNPTYAQVTSGTSGHTEAVAVVYDPARVSYAQLLEVFWRNIDPLDAKGQFCDRGSQYRSGIFVRTAEERRLAEASRQEVARRLGRPVVTEITTASAFYPAEEYHQNYYQKNPVRYKYYRSSCGRDRRLRELWGRE
jgi:peptide-methionine (S)-S-oxide reductase